MATTATPKHTALTRRDAAVTRWEAAEADLRKAQRDERAAPKPSAARAVARAARLSAGARKSNARHAIGEAELDLRLDGVEGWTPWTEPEAPADLASGRKPRATQAQLQAQLDKVRALIGTLKKGQDDAVAHQAEIRIKAIRAQAENAGYSLS